jgi:hypothetical protein
MRVYSGERVRVVGIKARVEIRGGSHLSIANSGSADDTAGAVKLMMGDPKKRWSVAPYLTYWKSADLLPFTARIPNVSLGNF